MYEAAKVEQRTSCSDLKDQIAENAEKCKANYQVIDDDIGSSGFAFSEHFKNIYQSENAYSPYASDRYEGEPACIIITIMTDFDWYNDRYSKYSDEETCIHAIQYISQFLSHYNDLYDRNLKSENVTD